MTRDVDIVVDLEAGAVSVRAPGQGAGMIDTPPNVARLHRDLFMQRSGGEIEPAKIDTIEVLETLKEGKTVWARAEHAR